MKRLIIGNLSQWFHSKRRKPLILRGARQVGKSTAIRLFAKEAQLDLIEINFEKDFIRPAKEGIKVKQFIQDIEISTQKKITEKSLLFFDEIQACPEAINYLRYFYEEYPQMAVIAAGSLLEFVLNSQQFSMPVGRIQYLYLGPMTFSEFLIACDQTQLVDWLENLKNINELTETIHHKLLGHFKDYLIVGGMPEAVKTFVETQSYLSAKDVHKEIISTYRDDFAKYSSKNEIPRIKKVFEKMPHLLGKKIKYSEIDVDERSLNLKSCLQLLTYARILRPCYHSNAKEISLAADADESITKYFFLDVGLLSSILNIAWQNFKFDVESPIKGLFLEQFVAQHLGNNLSTDQKIYYWLRDKTKNNAEVDFIIEDNSKFYPIEVKTNRINKLTSLMCFLQDHSQIKRSINLHLQEKLDENNLGPKKIDRMLFDKKITGEILQLPVYFTEYLFKLLPRD